MERILIIGCSGSGKTTLARGLADKTGLPLVHLDRLWWRDGWKHISREAFDAQLARLLERPRWIMDGNFSRTLPMRLEKCDTVLFLDFSRRACIWGVVKRVVTNYGRSRADMPEGCPERFDLEFIRWIWDFRKQVRPRQYELLAQAEREHGVQGIILKNRKEAERFLQKL